MLLSASPVADDHELLDSRTPVASDDVFVQHFCTVRHEKHRVANDASSPMFVFSNHAQPELLGDTCVTLHA